MTRKLLKLLMSSISFLNLFGKTDIFIQGWPGTYYNARQIAKFVFKGNDSRVLLYGIKVCLEIPLPNLVESENSGWFYFADLLITTHGPNVAKSDSGFYWQVIAAQKRPGLKARVLKRSNQLWILPYQIHGLRKQVIDSGDDSGAGLIGLLGLNHGDELFCQVHVGKLQGVLAYLAVGTGGGDGPGAVRSRGGRAIGTTGGR